MCACVCFDFNFFSSFVCKFWSLECLKNASIFVCPTSMVKFDFRLCIHLSFLFTNSALPVVYVRLPSSIFGKCCALSRLHTHSSERANHERSGNCELKHKRPRRMYFINRRWFLVETYRRSFSLSLHGSFLHMQIRELPFCIVYSGWFFFLLSFEYMEWM